MRGIVLSEDDAPIEGARLLVLSSEEKVSTDRHGRFVMEPFFSGSIEPLVSKQGYMPLRQSRRDQSVDRITLERSDPTQGAVSCTIGDEEGPEGTTLFEAVEPATYRLLLQRLEKKDVFLTYLPSVRLARQEAVEVTADTLIKLRIEAKDKMP